MARRRQSRTPGWGSFPATTDVPGTARVIAHATLVTAVAAAGYIALSDLPMRTQLVLWALLAIASASSMVVWASLRNGTRHEHRTWAALVAWSVAQVALVSVAVAVTGGSASDVAFLYVLPLLFFSLVFGRATQAMLFVVMVAGYLSASLEAPEAISGSAAALRLGTLAGLAVLSNHLSRRSHEQAEEYRQAETLAERRSQLLAVAALAGRSLSRLEVDEVLDNLVRAAAGLGFPTVALFVVDRDAGVTRCDRQFGLTQPWQGYTQPIDRGLVGEIVRGGHPKTVSMASGEPGAPEELLGSGLVAVTGTPIFDQHGTVTAVMCVADDQHHRPEPEQVEALGLLAALAGAALVNARRFEVEAAARERLESLSRLQDDFLATASHELRTPMTIVRGAAEILVDKWDRLSDQQRRTFVGRIDRHSQDLQRLADRLLQFHELDTGGQEPEPVQVELAPLVSTVTDRTAYLTRNHDVVWDVQPGLHVLVDPGMVETALEALLDNAARYTPPATRIRLSAVSLGEHVRLTVADHGPGVPPEVLDGLTEAFRRAGDVLTRTTRGIGLGLSTVERIARLHGGELELRNRPGGGMVASFAVPALAAESPVSGRRLYASEVIDLRDRTRAGRRAG